VKKSDYDYDQDFDISTSEKSFHNDREIPLRSFDSSSGDFDSSNNFGSSRSSNSNMGMGSKKSGAFDSTSPSKQNRRKMAMVVKKPQDRKAFITDLEGELTHFLAKPRSSKTIDDGTTSTTSRTTKSSHGSKEGSRKQADVFSEHDRSMMNLETHYSSPTQQDSMRFSDNSLRKNRRGSNGSSRNHNSVTHHSEWDWADQSSDWMNIQTASQNGFPENFPEFPDLEEDERVQRLNDQEDSHIDFNSTSMDNEKRRVRKPTSRRMQKQQEMQNAIQRVRRESYKSEEQSGEFGSGDFSADRSADFSVGSSSHHTSQTESTQPRRRSQTKIRRSKSRDSCRSSSDDSEDISPPTSCSTMNTSNTNTSSNSTSVRRRSGTSSRHGNRSTAVRSKSGDTTRVRTKSTDRTRHRSKSRDRVKSRDKSQDKSRDRSNRQQRSMSPTKQAAVRQRRMSGSHHKPRSRSNDQAAKYGYGSAEPTSSHSLNSQEQIPHSSQSRRGRRRASLSNSVSTNQPMMPTPCAPSGRSSTWGGSSHGQQPQSMHQAPQPTHCRSERGRRRSSMTMLSSSNHDTDERVEHRRGKSASANRRRSAGDIKMKRDAQNMASQSMHTRTTTASGSSREIRVTPPPKSRQARHREDRSRHRSRSAKGRRSRSKSIDRSSRSLRADELLPEHLSNVLTRSSNHDSQLEKLALAILVAEDGDNKVLDQNIHDAVENLPSHLLDPSKVRLNMQW